MITGIPTPEQFRQAGVDYLLMAHYALLGLLSGAEAYAELEAQLARDDQKAREDQEAFEALLPLEAQAQAQAQAQAAWAKEHLQAEPEGQPQQTGLVDQHWAQVARKLASCGSLIHQGAEFLLKSRIAAVSPYLLLEGGKETWSATVAAADTDFTHFRTIDAQLLPRVHDATCATRLNTDFKQRLEVIRQRRNAATHGVVSMVASHAGVMIHDILEVAHNLLGERSWPKIVREDLYAGPAQWADHHGATQRSLLDTWAQTLQLLTASEYVRYVGFSKKQRLYLCPHCHSGDLVPEPPIKLAYLVPNNPAATKIYCFVCGETIEVVREKCFKCKGNVIQKDDEPLCLSCHRTQTVG